MVETCTWKYDGKDSEKLSLKKELSQVQVVFKIILSTVSSVMFVSRLKAACLDVIVNKNNFGKSMVHMYFESRKLLSETFDFLAN